MATLLDDPRFADLRRRADEIGFLAVIVGPDECLPGTGTHRNTDGHVVIACPGVRVMFRDIPDALALDAMLGLVAQFVLTPGSSASRVSFGPGESETGSGLIFSEQAVGQSLTRDRPGDPAPSNRKERRREAREKRATERQAA